jgi:hypothetical protein
MIEPAKFKVGQKVSNVNPGIVRHGIVAWVEPDEQVLAYRHYSVEMPIDGVKRLLGYLEPQLSAVEEE